MKLQQVPGAQSCQDHCTNKHCIYMDFRSRAQLGKCCRNSCMSLFLTEGIQFQMTSNLFFLLKNPWGSTQYNYIMLTFLAEQGCQLTKTKMCILNEGGRILQDLFFFFLPLEHYVLQLWKAELTDLTQKKQIFSSYKI